MIFFSLNGRESTLTDSNLYPTKMSTCSAFTLSGNTCKNTRGLVGGLCSKHRNALFPSYGGCEALLVKGARKGQSCGAKTSSDVKFCKRHLVSSKAPAQTASFVGMLFKIEEDGEYKISLFGSFATVEACRVVAEEIMKSFDEKAEEVDMPTVNDCVASWSLGQNIQVGIVKVMPRNPLVGSPPSPKAPLVGSPPSLKAPLVGSLPSLKAPSASPPKPVAKKTAKTPCAFILSKGKRKGLECGKSATFDGYCSKHKSVPPPTPTPTFVSTPAPEIGDLMVEAVEKTYFSAQASLTLTDASPPVYTKSHLDIADTNEVAFTHKKETIFVHFDVILPEDKANFECTLSDGSLLRRADEKFILTKQDKIFKGAVLYEAYKSIIKEMCFDVSIERIYYTGKSLRVETADN